MGCSSMCNNDVVFEQVDMKISKKNVKTLERYGKGAIGRRIANKRRLEFVQEVADLRSPSYSTEAGEEKVIFTGSKIMEDDDLQRWLGSQNGGKDLAWTNYFIKIEDSSAEIHDSKEYLEYKGQWHSSSKNIWQGFGILKSKDGSVYQGMTENQEYNGKGRMTHVNGDIYQGEWKDGKANGYGIFVDTNGSMYTGNWVHDQQHGQGTESWNYNKITYTGDFLDGKKTGNGRFEFEGGFYEGQFLDGKFHGYGKYYFADTGKLYEGEFKENNMDGKGLMIWPDHSRYEGEFKSGKIEGQGKKEFTNGNKYVGDWKSDAMHGHGVWHDIKNQTKRQGEWINGKRVCWEGVAKDTHVSSMSEKIERNSQLASRSSSPFMRSKNSYAVLGSASKISN